LEQEKGPSPKGGCGEVEKTILFFHTNSKKKKKTHKVRGHGPESKKGRKQEGLYKIYRKMEGTSYEPSKKEGGKSGETQCSWETRENQDGVASKKTNHRTGVGGEAQDQGVKKVKDRNVVHCGSKKKKPKSKDDGRLSRQRIKESSLIGEKESAKGDTVEKARKTPKKVGTLKDKKSE